MAEEPRGYDRPQTRGSRFAPKNLLRKTVTAPVIVLVLLAALVGAAGGGTGYLLGNGGVAATPAPSVSASGSTSTSAPPSEPAPSVSQLPSATQAGSAILMSAACKWAYPGQATGKISGSAYSIVCLGANGQVLGGFSGSHSLNAWCADPRHTNGKHLPNPALVKGSWACTT